jgi:hypothetical protein
MLLISSVCFGQIQVSGVKFNTGTKVNMPAPSAFTFNETGETIIAYSVAIGGLNVVLPSDNNGTTVTTIGEAAFADMDITGLTFPDPNTITSIGANAFRNHAINVLTFPTTNPVTNFGLGAFRITNGTSAGCTYLGLPATSGITYASSVFNGNANLTNLFATGLLNMTSIPDLMFGGCTSLAQVQMHSGTWASPSPDGDNYGNVVTIGASAFIGTNVSTITIPNSCTTIADGAFMTIPGISKIIIPAGVSIASANSFNNQGGTQASFKAFYEAGGSLAGTYEYSGGSWSKTY